LSFTVRGEAAANGALNRLAQNFRRGLLGGGHAAVAIVVRTAQQGILNGGKSGKVYTTFFRTNRKTGAIFAVGNRSPHKASAPGEYSANDTGALVGSIGGINTLFQMRVWARAPHAGYQEFGTPPNFGGFGGMKPRPNIGNAVRDSEPQVTAVLGQYTWRAIQ
jgi:hypothetical protein